MRSISLLGALLLAGCIFDSSGIAPFASSMDGRDQSAMDRTVVLADAGAVDADGGAESGIPDGPAVDGSADQRVADQLVVDQLVVDQLVPDQLVPDQLVPDQLVPDQLVPDQLVPDQQTAKPPCLTTYGGISGFIQLCSETATECMFYYSSGSCDDKCQAGGGTCIKAAMELNDSCTPSTATACDYVHGDGLCTCTR